MRRKPVFRLVAIMLFSLVAISCGSSADTNDEVAVIETGYGRIVIEFLPDDAPKHVAHFKELIREGFFDGTKFHRIVGGGTPRPGAIQGGDPNTISGDPKTWGMGQPGQETVPAEFSNTLKHERGIVSAARKGNDKDSATSQFFICTAAAPPWDRNYTIFGRVIEGIETVDTIARAPVWSQTDRPMDPVTVTRAYLQKR